MLNSIQDQVREQGMLRTYLKITMITFLISIINTSTKGLVNRYLRLLTSVTHL